MSIYRKLLGTDFGKLHPKMQERCGLSPEKGIFMKGAGQMDRIWNAGIHTKPFLQLATMRNVMFPETGTKIPFTIENYSYTDSFGRETIAWIRKFYFKNTTRNFDETMVYSEKQKRIISYLGTKQHRVADLELKANADGSITIRSGAQRFYENQISFNYPDLFSGIAEVNEAYDEKNDRFTISVKVNNKTFGEVFGYSGFYKAEYANIKPGEIPAYAKPLREEVRE
ncbi:MAG: DUF4166 domain-containing protein [Bacteroidota bacterium]|nr:DUF4166 domain-containing protein [Bacteroidota bacterium]